MNAENPFEEKEIAEQWIHSVEGERGLIRDNEIYPALKQWFDSTQKGVVVDIGSGQGICASKISGYSKYLGIEPSTFLIERAKKLYTSKSTAFIVGNAYKLPSEKNTYDTAFSINVWFHLEDLNLASKELARVLKSRGKFFLQTADSDALTVWKKSYIKPTIQGKKILGEAIVPINNLSMNTFYMHTNEEMITALEEAGLRVTKITKLGKIENNTIFIAIEGEKS